MSTGVDLDAFLTQIEAKLRAPFAALLDKALPEQDDYLSHLAAVLPRAEKVTQLRVLLGLLAWEPSVEHDPLLKEIVQAAQVAPVYEEWVRVLAGIVEEMLFGEDESERGEGNEMHLKKTCLEILDRLRKLEATTDDDNAPVDDADPLFVPFRYHLLPPQLLQSVLPEASVHAHFQINNEAEILQMDARVELEKAKEEHEHPRMGAAPNGVPPASAGTATTVRPDMAPTQRKPAAAARPKSSMFLPSTKPRAVAVGTAAKPTGLHQRKAALSLVMKGRRGGGAAARAVPNRTAEPGRAVAATKSKMKMIDVAEVQGLEQSKAKPQATPDGAGRGRKSILAGKKRPHPDTETPRTVEPATKAPVVQAPAPNEPAAGAGDLASAALLAYQQQAALPRRDSVKAKQQDWRELLQQRSNRLSEDDRRRIQQFFVDHANPTPELTTYKMKVHEERTTDAKTGQAVKETYYLELDYTNYTSTQTKKVKRYGDDH
jgi:hypothetical protein